MKVQSNEPVSCLMQATFGFISRCRFSLGRVDHCSHPRASVIITECWFYKGIKRLLWRSRSHFTITHGKWVDFIHPCCYCCWVQDYCISFFLFNVKEKEVCHDFLMEALKDFSHNLQ